jgi:hypothetical protein
MGGFIISPLCTPHLLYLLIFQANPLSIKVDNGDHLESYSVPSPSLSSLKGN